MGNQTNIKSLHSTYSTAAFKYHLYKVPYYKGRNRNLPDAYLTYALEQMKIIDNTKDNA